MTRALVVDDHPIALQGARTILEDMGIAGIDEATTIRHGYRLCLRHKPDVAIIDLTLKGDDLGGLPLIERMSSRAAATRIIAFSMHNDPSIVARALAAGAAAYVLKDAPSDELAVAVQRVLAGEVYVSHALAITVAMLWARRDTSSTDVLTQREAQILTLLGQGLGYEKIADRLRISVKTVGNATSVMRSKLKLSSLADLIRFAMQQEGVVRSP